jgi:hypothetical protein
MKNESTLNNGLRNANEPYTIHLDNDGYELTQSAIDQNVDLKTRRKKNWQSVKLQFLSFENGVLRLTALSLHDKEKFDLTISVEPNRLHVTCSCGLPVEKLCRHAYAALSKVSYSYFDSGFFKKYQPNGLVEIALQHRSFFHIKQTDKSLNIEPGKMLGPIYKLSVSEKLYSLTAALKLSGTPTPGKVIKEETALSYLLMFSNRRALPFLIPAEAKLTQTGKAIKGFLRYIQNTEDPMAEGQLPVFQKCFQLMNLVKRMPGTIKENLEVGISELEGVFSLWKEVLPQIKHQPFIFRTRHWLWRMLKQKPRKMDSYPVRLSDQAPSVQFELVDKKEYYKLQLTVMINGAVLQQYDTCRLFIFYKEWVYMLGSLRDAAIVEFMSEIGGCLTIFKENFDEFEEQILFQLSEAYFVKNYSENH